MAGKRDTEKEKMMEDLPRKSMDSETVSAGATKQPGKRGFLPWGFLPSLGEQSQLLECRPRPELALWEIQTHQGQFGHNLSMPLLEKDRSLPGGAHPLLHCPQREPSQPGPGPAGAGRSAGIIWGWSKALPRLGEALAASLRRGGL